MDRVISIFIGGTSEGLKFADKVKGEFEKLGKVQCTVWSRDTFQYNESFLDSLSKASIIHDFGIFIASSDDLALVREQIIEVTRDNVIFEYGLFLGAMGNNRTFLLQEEDCKLPTDLLGFSTPRFKRTFKSEKWSDLIGEIYDNILIQFDKSEIQLLPSTSLAIGYFNSFVSKVTKHIFDNDGCLLNKSNNHHKEVEFKLLIPSELSTDIGAKAQLYYKKGNYELEEIGDNKRPFPIRFFKNEEEGKLMIIDIPTTLNAIRPAIDLLIPDRGLGNNPDKLKLERKELENFKKTIDYLVSQDDYANDIVKTEWSE
jgi:hypothetical protein